MGKATILIVDDNAENLTVLGELLHEHHLVRAASSGPRALALAVRQPLPDLILLDVMMPNMNGYEVLQRLKAHPVTADIPVIFTTAMNATEDEQHGLALGAVDYMTKPLRPAIVLARVKTHLALRQATRQLLRDNASLEGQIEQRLHENQIVQEVTIRALARMAETRDNDTGQHILRTQAYVRLRASLVSDRPRFKSQLDPRSIALIVKSAPLHDIGKVGIPDHVLRKPGKLDAAEWAVMKTHASLGADALQRAVADTREPVPFLGFAMEIVRHHHERWDGSGYPDGLAGDAIPLSARLMAVADVFDALISRRVYKPAMAFAEVRELMADLRGVQFDPDLLDAFVEHFDDFCSIARSLPDTEAPTAVSQAVRQPPPG